jgi:hypothetical protein
MRRWLILLLGGLALAACGGEPFDYVPPDEMRPGPGVLSGEDGEFVIYRR